MPEETQPAAGAEAPRTAVRMSDIARAVNVSQATVSRVLSGKGTDFISEATRTKVLRAASSMGFQLNPVARGLATGRTQVVALWIRNPDAPFYARAVRALQSAIAASGFDMILCGFPDAGQPLGIDHDIPTRLTLWPVDGVIAADCPELASAYLSRGRTRAALVGLGSDFPREADYAGCDYVGGVEAAVRHLVEIGCRNIAHLTGERAVPRVRRERQEAYVRVLTDAGMRPNVLVAQNESRAAARAAIIAEVRTAGPPDGLFCINDDMAIGAYRGLRDLGLRVPEDVALVGCDDIPDVEYLDVPLTTVHQPIEQLAVAAWHALQARILAPDAPLSQTLLPAALVRRASTRR